MNLGFLGEDQQRKRRKRSTKNKSSNNFSCMNGEIFSLNYSNDQYNYKKWANLAPQESIDLINQYRQPTKKLPLNLYSLISSIIRGKMMIPNVHCGLSEPGTKNYIYLLKALPIHHTSWAGATVPDFWTKNKEEKRWAACLSSHTNAFLPDP